MQRMRDLLRGSLSSSLRALGPEDRLAAAWPVACGRTMAERGVISAFSGGVLWVQVEDPAWLAQMKAMRSLLTSDLARIAGVPLTAIHFDLKQGTTPKQGTTS